MPSAFERRFQIFVSSTFTDLQNERQKVLQAILEMKAFPSGMELFPAADEEQWEFIKSEIDSSDIYLLVVGGRYGSIAPDGKSYTEQEHEYAVAQGKKIIAFLHYDPRKLAAELTETTDDRRLKLQKFRDSLKGRLVQFYQNPDDLKAKVWQSLSQTMALKQNGGWVRAEHSTRIEDLKRINDLQNQLAATKEELDNLKLARNNPRESLLQLSDSMVFRPIANESSHVLLPNECEVSLQLNEIFLAGFPGANSSVHVATVERNFSAMIAVKIKERYPTIEIAVNTHYLVKNIGELSNIAQIQFQAIGLITSEFNSQEGTRWYLTSEGLLQLGLLRGLVR